MVTVEWKAAAYEDFTEMCLHASRREERERIQRATHQIDRLLEISPSNAGETIFAGQPEPVIMTLLWIRQGGRASKWSNPGFCPARDIRQ